MMCGIGKSDTFDVTLKIENRREKKIDQVFLSKAFIALIWFKAAFLLADFELYARYVFHIMRICFFFPFYI